MCFWEDTCTYMYMYSKFFARCDAANERILVRSKK